MISLETYIYTRHPKDNHLCCCHNCRAIFPSLMLKPTNLSDLPPYFIDNWKSGNILLNNAHEIKLDMADYEGAKYFESAQISTLSPFDKLVISIHTEEEIKEFVCSRILIQQPRGKRNNFNLLNTILRPSVLKEDNKFYSLPAITLPNDCTICEINPYFTPRTWSTPTKELKDSGTTINYSPHGDMLCFMEFLNLKIQDYHTLLISGSKQVDYREYTIISHSSMDPGPDEASETTYLDITTYVEFSTNAELYEFLKQVNAIPLDSSNTLFKVKFTDVKATGLHLFCNTRVIYWRS